MSQAVYSGMADLDGSVVGTLRVGSIAGRNPVRWNVTCERCGRQSTDTHARLTSGVAKCRNSACGKDEVRDATSETLASYRRREDAAEAAKQRQETERRRAETKRLERELAETHGRVNAAIRERILNGRDDELFVSPALRTATMSQAQADKYNREQADLFVKTTPEYSRYRSRETFDTIGRYLDLNHVQIVDADTLRHAFERLRDVSALREIEPLAPTPESEPQTTIEPGPLQEPTLRTDGMLGWDPDSGEERFYTNREIDHLSSEAYRRAFKLTREKLTVARRFW